MHSVVVPKIYPVASHTDNVGPCSIFVAIKGMKSDGLDYIKEAILKGATQIVVQFGAIISLDILNLIEKKNIKLIYVQNCRRALAELSAKALGSPAKKLKIIGITGTKGKTSTSYLVEHILRSAGYKTALLSTVKNKILNVEFNTSLTTCQPDYLHVFFDVCNQHEVEYVVLEVAAQAVTLDRIYGIEFDSVVFTNFSQEHGEFYSSMQDYFDAKCALFNLVKPGGIMAINADDHAVSVLRNTVQFSLIDSSVGYFATILNNSFSNLELELKYKNSVLKLSSNLFGIYNAYNILAAISVLDNLKLSSEVLQKAISTFSGVPGRLEKTILPNGAIAFIDYAHNPSSFQAVLSTLKSDKKIIVVFGAGGDRDVVKRPQLGHIASLYADIIILTADNPRTEKESDIINQIKAGIKDSDLDKVVIEFDREAAIKKAYTLSDSQTIILLLGKGPDEYQIYGNSKVYFSEKSILKNL